jgi:Site-specific recombinase XerD
MMSTFRDKRLDEITMADVEKFLDQILQKRTPSTRNRYRTTLHAIFNRAVRHGLLLVNPAKGSTKSKEPEGRIQYLTHEEETAVREALAPEAVRTGRPKLDMIRPDLRSLFSVSVHTGLRWSEQLALRWEDVDFLAGFITVTQSKSGYSRQVPMNSVVRSVLLDLAGQRTRPGDPDEMVFRRSYVVAANFFPKAIERAQKTLAAAGRDGSRIEGYTWHCNRHTFASRLVMAGVDLRSVQALGGWQTLTMVQRYSHLAPAHLREAVERLVDPSLEPTSVPSLSSQKRDQ